jgi:hypothetical protein
MLTMTREWTVWRGLFRAWIVWAVLCSLFFAYDFKQHYQARKGAVLTVPSLVEQVRAKIPEAYKGLTDEDLSNLLEKKSRFISVPKVGLIVGFPANVSKDEMSTILSDLERRYGTTSHTEIEAPAVFIGQQAIRDGIKGEWDGQTWRKVAESRDRHMAAMKNDATNAFWFILLPLIGGLVLRWIFQGFRRPARPDAPIA